MKALRQLGRAAGAAPAAAVTVLCVVLWLLGLGAIAAVIVLLVWLGTDLRDTAAEWWEDQGAVARVAVGAAFLVLAYVAGTEDWRPLVPMAAVAAALLGWRGYVTARSWEWIEHVNEYVIPTHEALTGPGGPLTELAGADPFAYLDIPPDMLQAEGGIVVTLPRGPILPDTRKTGVVDTVTAVCGLSDVRADWRWKGQARWLRLTSKASVPLEVLFSDADVRALVERARESRPLLALASGDREIAIDFDAESPHFLVAMGTGAGKSALIRLIMAKILHEGGMVVVCDIKRTSQHWAKGLDGVRYARTVPEIHDALVDVGREIDYRLEVAEGFGPDEQGAWPRLLVVCEEWALTYPELVEYWREIREKDDPKRSPAVRGYKVLLLAGRSSKANGIVVTQRGDAAELGGGQARTQFATRVVGRHDKNAWRLLMGDTPFVIPSKRRGRVWVSLHGSVTEAQVVFISEAEAIDYATAGKANPNPRVAMSRKASSPGETNRDGRGRPPLEVVPDIEEDPDRVTLPQVSTDRGDGRSGLTYDQLRAAVARDREFPPNLDAKRGRAWLYSLTAVQRWAANRERATGEAEG